MKTILLTSFAVTAFAANSILCRMALIHEGGVIDPAGFTVVRLLSGALVLWLLVRGQAAAPPPVATWNWRPGLMLFLYAVPFSFAYQSLNAAVGALILFGAVQITILAYALWTQGRLAPLEWLGGALALGGFAYLMAPNASAPAIGGSALMVLAGVAWGVYTLLGKGSKNPLADTAYNFRQTIPLAILTGLVMVSQANYSSTGVLLAALSGGLASGVGYAVWYAALRGLSATQAAIVQLAAPPLAGLGGMIFLGDPLTQQWMIASALILGGIAVVVRGKRK